MSLQSVYAPRIKPVDVIRDRASYEIMAVAIVLVALLMVMVGADAFAIAPTGTNHAECQVSVTNLAPFTPTSFFSGLPIGFGANPICNTLMSINDMIKGTTGKALATLALAALGCAALFGKINWTTAVAVVIGVALLFGAAGIMGGIGPTADIVNPFAAADPISAVLDVVSVSMTGATGRAIGIVCTLVLGVGALFGKITWTQAVMLMTGLGLVFGAVDLVLHIPFADPIDSGLMLLTVFNDPVAEPFAQIINLMVSELGVSIATAIVMCMGFMAMLGKLSWTRALILAAGISVMFGAADIVFILSGPLSTCVTANSDPFTKVLCGFAEELEGPMAKTIGTLGIMIVGVLAMLGKISWELSFIVVIGIGLVFGAPEIVNMFETSMGSITCTTTAPTPPSTGNAIADVLCYIVMIIYGPAGKALATIAVCMMGFGALMGKVSFTQAIIVGVGIAVTFGAPTIVTHLMPSANITGCAIATGPFNPLSGVWGTLFPGLC